MYILYKLEAVRQIFVWIELGRVATPFNKIRGGRSYYIDIRRTFIRDTRYIVTLYVKVI